MAKRQVEVFSAGCSLCDDAVKLVQNVACSSCEVSVHDMKDIKVAERAKALGITRVPAVVVDGKLAACCMGGPITEASLHATGIGQASL